MAAVESRGSEQQSQLQAQISCYLEDDVLGKADIVCVQRLSRVENLPDQLFSFRRTSNHFNNSIRAVSGPGQGSFCGVPQDMLSKAWVDTCKAINFRLKGDPFAGQGVGGYCNPSTIDSVTKQRSYAANTYFGPARNRTYLKVITNAVVNKISLDSSGAATGLEVLLDYTRYIVNAIKEVVLATGVF